MYKRWYLLNSFIRSAVVDDVKLRDISKCCNRSCRQLPTLPTAPDVPVRGVSILREATWRRRIPIRTDKSSVNARYKLNANQGTHTRLMLVSVCQQFCLPNKQPHLTVFPISCIHGQELTTTWYTEELRRNTSRGRAE